MLVSLNRIRSHTKTFFVSSYHRQRSVRHRLCRSCSYCCFNGRIDFNKITQHSCTCQPIYIDLILLAPGCIHDLRSVCLNFSISRMEMVDGIHPRSVDLPFKVWTCERLLFYQNLKYTALIDYPSGCHYLSF